MDTTLTLANRAVIVAVNIVYRTKANTVYISDTGIIPFRLRTLIAKLPGSFIKAPASRLTCPINDCHAKWLGHLFIT